jgi:urease accessory protein
MSAVVSPYEPGDGRAVLAGLRVRGGIDIVARLDGGSTVLGWLYETGGYRVKFPASKARFLEAVMINTGGGVAGGDHVRIAARAEDGAHLTLTTATAERIYRSIGPPSVINIGLRVDTGATLAWLPQATVLFSRAHLRRRIEADATATSRLLIAETSAFGRSASGETDLYGDISDHWRIRRDGQLVFAEALRLEGAWSRTLNARAVAGGATLSAFALAVAPDVEGRIEAVRAAIEAGRSVGGASTWNGLMTIRLLGRRLDHLADDLRAVTAALDLTPLPTAWTH